eukprot:2640271-Prymnesium_polylepis.1
MPPEQREALLKRLRKAIAATIAARWRSTSGRQVDTPSMQRRRRRSAADRPCCGRRVETW